MGRLAASAEGLPPAALALALIKATAEAAAAHQPQDAAPDP
jgi:hypothetical protein